MKFSPWLVFWATLKIIVIVIIVIVIMFVIYLLFIIYLFIYLFIIIIIFQEKQERGNTYAQSVTFTLNTVMTTPKTKCNHLH